MQYYPEKIQKKTIFYYPKKLSITFDDFRNVNFYESGYILSVFFYFLKS